MKTAPSPTDQSKRDYTERLLSRIGPLNQGPVREFLRDKEAIDRNKPASLMNQAIVLQGFDRFLQGGRITDATPGQVRDYLMEVARRTSPTTEWQHCVRLKQYLRAHHRGSLPYELARALKRKMPESHPQQVVTVEERDALLAAADRLPYPVNRIKTQALIWTLWDTGMRVGEICSLRVDSFAALGDGLGVLRMPQGVSGLKTGPRDVHIREAVKPIEMWLRLYRHGKTPEAALLPCGRQGGSTPYWPQAINALLKRLCKDAGIRMLHPHLFRHSWATRRFRDKWQLPVIGKNLGWSKNSKMYAIYIHLDQTDIIDQLRREAGLTSHALPAPPPAPKPPAPPAHVESSVIESELRRAFRRMFGGDEPAPAAPLIGEGGPPTAPAAR